MQRRFRDLEEYQDTPLGDCPEDAFIGLIRLCDLFADKIEITDMALLDGCLFHGFGPWRLLDLVGRPGERGTHAVFPFDVLSFGRDMEEGLKIAAAPPGNTHMRRLEFSALEVDEGRRVAIGKLMTSVPVRDFTDLVEQTNVPEALAQILVTRCDAPEPEVRALERHWKSWIHAEREGLFKVMPATRVWRDVVDQGFNFDPVGVMRGDVTVGARSVLSYLNADEQREAPRSDMLATLHERLPRAKSEQDREVVEAWYLASKLRGVAFANGVQPVEFVLGRPRDSVRRRLGRTPPAQSGRRRPISLPLETQKAVGIMPPAVYQMVRFQMRSALEQWKATEDGAAMQTIAYGLATAAEQVSPRSLLVGPLRLVVLAAAASGLDVYQNWSGWRSAWQIGIVVALLILSSWPEIRAFLELRGKTTATYDIAPARGGAIPRQLRTPAPSRQVDDAA